MPLTGIHSIWHRKITPGDFFNIERSAEAGPAGGGGQRYIDIPDSVREGLFRMLDLTPPAEDGGTWPPAHIMARVIGNTAVTGWLSFELNRASERRYRIANQNRQAAGGVRHPAWTAGNGFPQAADDVATLEEARQYIAEGLRVYIVRSLAGDFYAGFTQGDAVPPNWPVGLGLEVLFDQASPGGVILARSATGYHSVVARILDAWRRKPNVLLYGPPGTGKTYVMSCVWELLHLGEGGSVLMFDPEDRDCPFHVFHGELPMPLPVARDWVTFHQSYGYEDFMVGLRPVPVGLGEGLTLKPRSGKLLDLAVRVSLDAFPERSGALLIDEINRANVSRAFGEFIVLMEHEYRDVDGRGNDNPRRFPVPLASVNSSGGYTEPIALTGGGAVQLPAPWFFPRQIYTLSSMNSVDRTVAPLDSALSRRFERINMFPDLRELQRWLRVNLDEAQIKARDHQEGLNAAECAVLILARLNFRLATALGPDFEIGHTYFLPVASALDEADGFRRLAIVWDQGIMPQLQERFLARQNDLIRILGVDEAFDEYAFRRRRGMLGQDGEGIGVIEPVSLEELAEESMDRVQATFRHMASRL